MDDNTKNGSSATLSDETLKVALPLVAVGAFVLALSFAFCCYLARYKHQRPKINGYKKVVLNKKKDNPLQDTKNESCPVCLEDFQNKETIAICTCGHVFHKKCLKKWLHLKPTCPMCMTVIMEPFGRSHQIRSSTDQRSNQQGSVNSDARNPPIHARLQQEHNNTSVSLIP